MLDTLPKKVFQLREKAQNLRQRANELEEEAYRIASNTYKQVIREREDRLINKSEAFNFCSLTADSPYGSGKRRSTQLGTWSSLITRSCEERYTGSLMITVLEKSSGNFEVYLPEASIKHIIQPYWIRRTVNR